MTTLVYRLRYWFGKVCGAIGFCWRCRCALNYTRDGRGLCPNCQRRY